MLLNAYSIRYAFSILLSLLEAKAQIDAVFY
jgi:hypothetical protein